MFCFSGFSGLLLAFPYDQEVPIPMQPSKARTIITRQSTSHHHLADWTLPSRTYTKGTGEALVPGTKLDVSTFLCNMCLGGVDRKVFPASTNERKDSKESSQLKIHNSQVRFVIVNSAYTANTHV